MLAIVLIFGSVHSGLASVRDSAEKMIGERAFRVLFAGTSLPLAVSTIVSLSQIFDLSNTCFLCFLTGWLRGDSGVLYEPQVRWTTAMAASGCNWGSSTCVDIVFRLLSLPLPFHIQSLGGRGCR